VAEPLTVGIPRYAMLDVWMALGGDPQAFDRMMAEDRRTDADTWAQLLAVIARRWDALLADTNPPPGPEFDALVVALVATDPDPQTDSDQ